MNVKVIQSLTGETSLHSEVLLDLTRSEAEVKIAELKETETPLSPPTPGRWKLESWRYFQSPCALYKRMPIEAAKELETRGCLRVDWQTGRWIRIGRLVCRWKLLDGVKGIAAINRSKTHCSKGHPLSGDNLKITKEGYRRCILCSRVAVKASKLKAKAKKAALSGGSPEPSKPKKPEGANPLTGQQTGTSSKGA